MAGRLPLIFYRNLGYLSDFLSEFRVFLRPGVSLGSLWGSNWHQTSVLDDFGGQNGVPMEASRGTGAPLSAFVDHWEKMFRVMGAQNWQDDC